MLDEERNSLVNYASKNSVVSVGHDTMRVSKPPFLRDAVKRVIPF